MTDFISPTKGRLSFDQVVEELLDYLVRYSSERISIVVGSDSEQGPRTTEYICAIVAYRHGRGGRYFYSRRHEANCHSLRDRIWRETMLSATLAEQLRDAFTAAGNGFKNMQIHVDIGENGPTRELIKEICGFVRGIGFVVHIKPEAYAACAVADRQM